MAPAVEARFERIESILHAMAERENQMEERWEKRHALAMARMDIFDKKLEATRKLVESGIKFVVKLSVEVRELKGEIREVNREVRELGREVRELGREVREVSRIQKAMLRPHGNGHSSRN